jgi:hypothetical protein
MAVADAQQNGPDAWLGTALTSVRSQDRDELRAVVIRGLEELSQFLRTQRVQ